MTENICSHENCENSIYKDTKECILHCDKSEFDDNDLDNFWAKVRQTFIIEYTHMYNSTYNEVLIEDVLFPKFQDISGYDRNLNFNNSNGCFQENVRFKNCTFFDNFDLTYNQFIKSLNFEDCIFYDDINIGSIEKLILENCEFKKEFKLENSTCKNLEVKNTTFHKSIEILIKDTIVIDKNSRFHDKVFFKGLNDLDVDCQNSKFKKEIIFSATKNIKLLGLTLKSNIDFGENIEKLEIIDCFTGILELNNTKEFLLNNLTSPKLTSTGERCENILIENSIIDEIDLNASSYGKITIQNKTESNEIKINNSANVIISDSALNEIKMLGKNYTSLSIKNTKISNSFEANSINGIVFDNVKMNPKIVLNENNYPKIVFKNSDFDSLMISPAMFNDDSISNANSFIELEKTTVQNECKISKVVTLEILDSEFNGLFTVDTCNGTFKIEDSKFKGTIIFNSSKFHRLEIENISCLDVVSFKSAQIDNLTIRGLNPESNKFTSLVDFSNIIIKTIHIDSTIFEDEVKFNDINYINFSSISRNNINKLAICNTTVDDLFKDSKFLIIDTLVLDSVKLKSSVIEEQINLKKIKIDDFKCNKLILQGEMNFDEMTINHFTIANSNIEKVFRIKYSQIKDTFFTDTTFEDLQIIDNKNDDFTEKRELRLKNTTIKSTVLDKLKLDNFNMREAHVSDAKIGYVKFTKGSRETNRFFKNYYDSISDYIKADTYYRDEMEEQFKVSKGREWWLLLFNKGISNFGQNWVRPLVWIFGLGIAFYILFHFQLLITEGYLINHKMIEWNNFWEFMNPFSKKATVEYQNVYGWWMIHKLLTTALIYHFIVAIKRKTKR